MSPKPERSFHARVDVLERRELLSRAPAIDTNSHIYSNVGFGAAEVLSYGNLPGGGYKASGRLIGVSNSFGVFTGTVSGTVSLTGQGNATAVLHAADGDILDLGITGSYKSVSGYHYSKTLTGEFTYTVTGGTGEFAHASGSGPLNVTANLATYAVRFRFSGKIML